MRRPPVASDGRAEELRHGDRPAGQERGLVHDPELGSGEGRRRRVVEHVVADVDARRIQTQAGEVGELSRRGRVCVDREQGPSERRVRPHGDPHQHPGRSAVAAAVRRHHESSGVLVVEDLRVERIRGRLAGAGAERRPERLQRDRPDVECPGRPVENGVAAVRQADQMRRPGRTLSVGRDHPVVVQHDVQHAGKRADERRRRGDRCRRRPGQEGPWGRSGARDVLGCRRPRGLAGPGHQERPRHFAEPDRTRCLRLQERIETSHVLMRDGDAAKPVRVGRRRRGPCLLRLLARQDCRARGDQHRESGRGHPHPLASMTDRQTFSHSARL